MERRDPFAMVGAIGLLAVMLSSCQLGRYIFYNFADINDHRKFQNRELHRDSVAFAFSTAIDGKVPKMVNTVPFDTYLEDNNTVAFLIIQHDSIQCEKYFRGYDKERVVPSFSMAKSITSLLIGCAIDEQLIRSVNEPITNYIPELKANGFDKVTIRHLLQMTSGIRFNESYSNPFGDAASFYYGRDLRRQIEKMRLERAPGEHFAYASGNTQLLGLVLERALKGTTITDYLEQKIWKPLGMESDASWSLDRKTNGLEKTFCCINATARDFAKIGRLYLNKGEWNGKRIVSQQWVAESTRIDTTDGSVNYYQYQWWLPSGNGDFMAQGILGQFIYVHPTKDLIIVRLGKNEGRANWWTIFTTMASSY
jgi:CubicO group peptidase (beta-lactamase class C family)